MRLERFANRVGFAFASVPRRRFGGCVLPRNVYCSVRLAPGGVVQGARARGDQHSTDGSRTVVRIKPQPHRRRPKPRRARAGRPGSAEKAPSADHVACSVRQRESSCARPSPERAMRDALLFKATRDPGAVPAGLLPVPEPLVRVTARVERPSPPEEPPACRSDHRFPGRLGHPYVHRRSRGPARRRRPRTARARERGDEGHQPASKTLKSFLGFGPGGS